MHKKNCTQITYIRIMPTDFMCLTVLLVQLIHCWRRQRQFQKYGG